MKHLGRSSFQCGNGACPVKRRNFTHSSGFSIRRHLASDVAFVLTPGNRFGSICPFLFRLRLACRLFRGRLSIVCGIGGLSRGAVCCSVKKRPNFGIPLARNRTFRSCCIGVAPRASQRHLLLRKPCLTTSGTLRIRRGGFPLRERLFLGSTVVLGAPRPAAIALTSGGNRRKIAVSCRSFSCLNV